MIKKIVIGTVATAALAAVALTAMGGVSWIDSTGLLGAKRQVEARVQGYWQARVAGEAEQMAEYLHPLQEMVPDAGMLVTEEFTLNELAVDGDEALAKLTVRTRLRHPVLSARERTVEIENRWVRYEGQWYKDVAPTTIQDIIKHHQGRWTPPTAKADTIPADEQYTPVQ